MSTSTSKPNAATSAPPSAAASTNEIPIQVPSAPSFNAPPASTKAAQQSVEDITARIAALEAQQKKPSSQRTLRSELKAVTTKRGYPKGCLGPGLCKNLVCDHKYGTQFKTGTAPVVPALKDPSQEDRVLEMVMAKCEKDGYMVTKGFALAHLTQHKNMLIPAVKAIKQYIDERTEMLNSTGRISLAWESQACDADADNFTGPIYNKVNRRRMPLQRDAFLRYLEQEDDTLIGIIRIGPSYVSMLKDAAEKLKYYNYHKCEANFRDARARYYAETKAKITSEKKGSDNKGNGGDDVDVDVKVEEMMVKWDDDHADVSSVVRSSYRNIQNYEAIKEEIGKDAFKTYLDTMEQLVFEVDEDYKSVAVEKVVKEHKTVIVEGVKKEHESATVEVDQQPQLANFNSQGWRQPDKPRDTSSIAISDVTGPSSNPFISKIRHGTIRPSLYQPKNLQPPSNPALAETAWLRYIIECNIPRPGEEPWSYELNGAMFYRAPSEIESERRGVKTTTGYQTYYQGPYRSIGAKRPPFPVSPEPTDLPLGVDSIGGIDVEYAGFDSASTEANQLIDDVLNNHSVGVDIGDDEFRGPIMKDGWDAVD